MITRPAITEDTTQPCPHCDEPILLCEGVVVVPIFDGAENLPRAWHFECFQRGLIGSVAHQMRSCSCYVAGSSCNDDPKLSKRDAARAAVQYWTSRRQLAAT